MRAFQKDFIREITKNRGRFLSVFFIVLLGAAFFSGIRSSRGDMEKSADQYYDEVNYMDLRVISTLGLTDEDLEDLNRVDGVERAVGGRTLEVLHEIDETEQVVKLIALSDEVNLPEVLEGRMPEDPSECLVDSRFLEFSGCKIGDEITFLTGTDDPLSDALSRDTFTVVGTASLPYYMDLSRGTGSIGDGSIDSFALLMPEVFTSEIYTEIYLQAEGTKEMASYGSAYEARVNEIQEKVEALADEACQRRYRSVYEEGMTKLADARGEVEDAEQELLDAWEELQDGEQQIADAKDTLAKKEQELFDGTAELSEKEQELLDGKKALRSGEQELLDAKAVLSEKEREFLAGRAELTEKEAELLAGKETLETQAGELLAGKAQLEEKAAMLAAQKAQLEEKAGELEQGKAVLEEKAAALEEGKAELSAKRQELENGKLQLQAAQAEWEASHQRLASARAELESNKEQFALAEQQYEAAKTQLQEISGTQIPAVEAGIAGLTAQIGTIDQQLAGLDPETSPEYAALTAQREALVSAREEQEGNLARLTEAKRALEEGIAEFERTGEETRQALEAAESQITAGEQQLAAGAETLEQKNQEIAAGELALQAAEQQIQEGEQQLAAAGTELERGERELAAYREELADGERQIAEAGKQLADGEAQINAYRETIADGERQMTEAKQQLLEGERQIAEAKRQLSDGEHELADSGNKLADGERKLAEAKQTIRDGQSALAEAKSELAEKEQELADGKKEYEDARAEAEPELADAREEIAEKEQELLDLSEPDWYVWDRSKVSSTENFGEDAGRINNIGKFFPVIFFLVAALVSLTTMTRMIEEQRLQIGTLKALGYSDGIIAMRYFSYAMLSTVTGALAGVLIGEKILPWVIMNAYGMLYTGLPYYLTPLNWQEGGLAILASAACTGAATLGACYRELSAKPAELMRPEAPKNGKRIFLERVGIVWSHLNFTMKSTVRNLVRYKKRFFMTVIGIGGCMGLIVVGFGLQDSITAIAKNQFVNLFTYQANAVFAPSTKEADKEALQEELLHAPGMEQLLEMYCQNVELSSERRSIDAVLEVPKELTHFEEFFDFRDRVTGEQYDFPQTGAAISEKTADLLGIEKGDTIQLKMGDEITEVPVTVIIENYVRHFLYISSDTYETLFAEKPAYNQLLMRYEDTSEEKEKELGELVMGYDGVSAISFTTDLIQEIDDMLRSLDIVICVLIVSAGLLAFVVLYNLNNINITERKRELATLKVLGFYDMEVASYVYRENLVLTLIGIFAGMGIGAFLHQYVIRTVEVDMMMFGRMIFPRSYFYSALITIAFALFVNLMMYYRLRKINMIESLKSVE